MGSFDSTRSRKLVGSVVESFDSTNCPKLPRVAVYRWKSVESMKIHCRVAFGGLKRQGRGGVARTARRNCLRVLADIGGAEAAAALISACSGSATKRAPWPLIQKARAFASPVSWSAQAPCVHGLYRPHIR